MNAFADICHSYIVFYEKKRTCPYVSVGLSYVYTDVRQFLFSYLINKSTTLSHLLHPSACVGLLPVKSERDVASWLIRDCFAATTVHESLFIFSFI